MRVRAGFCQGLHTDVLARERARADERLRLVTEFTSAPVRGRRLSAPLAHMRLEAACVVWDSLETWASSYTEQAHLARAVSAHGAAVKLILCGTNAAGDVEGLARLRRGWRCGRRARRGGMARQEVPLAAGLPQRFPRRPREDDEPCVLH